MFPELFWFVKDKTTGEHLAISQFWTEITSDFFWSHLCTTESQVESSGSSSFGTALWSKSMPRGGSDPGNALLRQNM